MSLPLIAALSRAHVLGVAGVPGGRERPSSALRGTASRDVVTSAGRDERDAARSTVILF